MPTYSQIQLHRGKGLTFAQIGLEFGISRQRVHAIFTGYIKLYQKGEEWKMYKRHSSHTHPKKVCTYCLL